MGAVAGIVDLSGLFQIGLFPIIEKKNDYWLFHCRWKLLSLNNDLEFQCFTLPAQTEAKEEH